MKKLAIIALSIATAFMGVAPAQAFPSAASAPKVQQTTDVQTVQYWGDRGRHHWRGDRGWGRDRYWDRGRHWDRGRYYGHRRHRGNAGAVIGGLALGAIVGGAIANSQPRYAPAPRYYRGASSHTQWCANRYRSYRAYDNTFQPYNGPRQQCYSPY